MNSAVVAQHRAGCAGSRGGGLRSLGWSGPGCGCLAGVQWHWWPVDAAGPARLRDLGSTGRVRRTYREQSCRRPRPGIGGLDPGS